jgi:ubiquinone/menaquinone biosynthesis C-methylase UbiE
MSNLRWEQEIISGFLSDDELRDFVDSNLRKSLVSVGFSEKLADVLTRGSGFDVQWFQKEFSKELEEVYRIGFFQKLVPAYFETFVIPEIPPGKILDVGCGTGILIKKLAESASFKDLTGIDINEYSEWKSFEGSGIHFEVVTEEQFPEFLKTHQPDSATLTWALHHMRYDEQMRYLRMLFGVMKSGSKIIILEDSYSERLSPEGGEDRWRAFMKWSEDDRRKIMSVYDWVANRVLAQREHVPIPFGYRTMEDWIKVCEEVGFKLVKKKFIGFPGQRDINTPQSLMIFQK